MAKTKEDYRAMGRQAAKLGQPLKSRVATNWQQAAVIEGYDAERASWPRKQPDQSGPKVKEDLLHRSPVRTALGLHSLIHNFRAFPMVVLCHLDNLSFRYQFVKDEHRAKRYKRSAQACIQKWQNKKGSTDANLPSPVR